MKPKYLLGIIVIVIIVTLGMVAIYITSDSSDNSLNVADYVIKGDRVSVGLVPEEGISLAANYYASPGRVENRGVVLLHMLDRSQDDWNDFAAQLQTNNFEVMTFDFRGHGESSENWNDYEKEDFQKLITDAKDSLNYLRDINAEMDISIIGAGIGANVAMQVALEDPKIKSIVLLSPKTTNHGIDIEHANANYDRSVFYITGTKDKNSYSDTLELHEVSNAVNKSIKEIDTSNHGTDLLNEASLSEDIINWLTQN